ncbi:MAG TPA: hypothetical protein DEA08_13455 [Planctomycetes bacterium]|nr:hypothetical protein [Planctomycetota bacterium]
MRGRRSVWSLPDIQKLAANFVSATDEVWRLHHLKDPECELFQSFMNEGIYKRENGGGSTRQGIFAVAPSGALLADVNTTRPGPMRKMLQDALAAWKALPRSERLLPYDPAERRDRIKRAEQKFPQDGVALRVTVRDLPRRDLPGDWRAKAYNVDYAWFRASELQSLLPKRVKKGASQPWPKALTERVVRLQLLDYVRGQTVPYDPEHLHEATLTTEVVKVKKKAVELRFSGAVRVCSGAWSDTPDGSQTRGTKAALLGEATFDRKRGRFSRFELVAVGVRWGRTQFNFRQDDLPPSPIGWVFQLAPEGERVAPAHLGAYGW